MATAFISLGCNLGNCPAYLAQAIQMLDKHLLIRVTRVSSVYYTEPVGEVEQPYFLNMAVKVDTDLKPAELLHACRRVEEELGGRDGRVPQGPRTIDLDILLYDQLEIAEKDLVIPHPRMLKRAFALVPLAEIAPEAALPGGGTVAAAAERLRDQLSVEKQGPLEGL